MKPALPAWRFYSFVNRVGCFPKFRSLIELADYFPQVKKLKYLIITRWDDWKRPYETSV